MELGAILLILALSALVALFVAQPFLERRVFKMVSAEEHTSSWLMAERDRLIGALQELDFDHTLGKIPAEDYPVMRAQLRAQAADVLRKLDELTPASEKGRKQKALAEERVEAEVAAHREDAAVAGKKPAAVADDDVEELLAARRAARKEKTAGFCSKCGKPLMKSDKFCPSCGNPT
ncbi:MAG: zinc ribbon domain-containing protein [Anaerolineales bacterium]